MPQNNARPRRPTRRALREIFPNFSQSPGRYEQDAHVADPPIDEEPINIPADENEVLEELLEEYLPNAEDQSSTDEDRLRIIANMKAWADAQVSPAELTFSDRAMTLGIIKIFQKDLQPTDLLYLPVVAQSFELWGVYINIAMEDDRDTVKGLHIGSSVAYKTYIGIRGRVEYHLRQSYKKYRNFPEIKKSRHPELICQPTIIPNFRALALFEVKPANTITTTIAEQLLLLYLSTMPSA